MPCTRSWQVDILKGLTSIVSVLHPKNLLVVFCRSFGIQVLLKVNVYMMQLLEHEKRCIEAEEQGEPAPQDAPPIPNFKPCFDRGLLLGCRELSVAMVRRVFEAIAVRRLGRSKADVLLRDAKSWIRDVLAFRHRQVSSGYASFLDMTSLTFLLCVFAYWWYSCFH